MHSRRLFAAHLFAFSTLDPALLAHQQTVPVPGSNWTSVKALPTGTKVHVTADHRSKTCRVFAVSDDAFTCAAGGVAAGMVLQRADIRHIKLAHYGRSTLVGAGICGGAGAASGAIAGRTRPCPIGQGFYLNGIGIGVSGVAAVFGVGGALLGSIVGGVPT